MRPWRPVLVAIALLVTGCDSWKNSEDWGFEKTLTKLEDEHRDFGEISVSRPVVIRDPGRLKFQLDKTADQFYTEIVAQLSGRVGSVDVTDARGALRVELPGAAPGNPLGRQVAFGLAEALVAAARSGQLPPGGGGDSSALLDLFSAGLTAGAPATQPATSQAPALTAAPDVEANSAGVRAAAIADAMEVFAAAPGVGLRPEDKIVGANSAFMRARIFEVLSDVNGFHAPEGEKFVVLVMNLSISPGNRTRKGYIAEISLCIEQEVVSDGNVVRDTAMIASVFPNAIGQNFDLEGLTAYQRNLAAALTAAVPGVAGKLILEGARLNEARLRGAGQLVSVASFNRSTNVFGLRVRGEFAPIDPREYVEQRKSEFTRPAVFLQDVNIPIVAVALLTDPDRLQQRHPNSEVRSRVLVDTRWVADRSDGSTKQTDADRDLSLANGWHRARAMDRFSTQIRTATDQAPAGSRERDWLETAPHTAMFSALTGYKMYFPLSENAFKADRALPPVIATAYPREIRGDRPTAVVVTGMNLSGSRFSVAGAPAAAEFVSADGTAALLVADARVLNRPDLTSQAVKLVAITAGGSSAPYDLQLISDNVANPKSTLIRDTSRAGAETWTLEDVNGGVRPNIFAPATQPSR